MHHGIQCLIHSLLYQTYPNVQFITFTNLKSMQRLYKQAKAHCCIVCFGFENVMKSSAKKATDYGGPLD